MSRRRPRLREARAEPREARGEPREARDVRNIRTCARCRRAVFDPARRDVGDWPLIDDLNASEHCAACWFELAGTLGRPLGKPDAPRGLPCPTIPSRSSSAA